jgi:adenosylmethionine-8-amino-7-oxononanoate aminotransferase
VGLARCSGIEGVADVRVKGASGVVELAGPLDHDTMRRQFLDRGCWIRPFGNSVYLMPALTIPPDELAQLIEAVVEGVNLRPLQSGSEPLGSEPFGTEPASTQ